MGDPHNSEDVKKVLDVIRAQGRPPFECPFCKRTYQSITGALYHLGVTAPHNDLIPRCALPATLLSTRSAGRNTPKPGSRAQSPASVRRKKIRQPLTYEESQRLVEVKLHNDYFRLQIDDELALGSNKDGTSDPEEGGVYSNPATPTNAMRSIGKSSKTTKAKASKRKGASKLTGKQEENGSALVQLPEVELEILADLDHPDAPDRVSAYFRYIEQSFEELDDLVEYDMDDEDYHWLDMMNEKRKEEGLPLASQDCFELLMDRFEKECFFESHLTDDPTDANPYNIDENAVCCICNDGECHNTNAILFCDMCNLAVHQECYGIPYIPEGQWLCRRCMHSPSRMVNCVLCPNKGGAFKQTADGRWSHMLCALWIPEVQFANPVFLEPIDSIEKIPPARWRLTCYICKCRFGACIQCSSKNCFVAFHVSCAQQNGLYMKVEVCGSTDVAVKKVAFCKMHSPRRGSVVEDVPPVDVEGVAEGGEDQDGQGESSTREQDADSDIDAPLRPRPVVPPIVNLPFVPQHRLNRISAKVSLTRKTQFIPVLVSYWKLKRQSRNGVPLLRRLQASSHGQRVNMYKLSEEELDTLKEQLTVWKKLRHDLERVRMLSELVCRREKQKKELVQLTQQVFECKVSPDMFLMKKMIHQLKKKDVAEIFAEPVPVDDVQDYLDVIKEPMDFSTMDKRVASFSYLTLDDFEQDFTLVWRNAMTYNDPSTVYYRAAVRMKLEGQRMIKLARDDLSYYTHNALLDSPLFYSPPVKPDGETPAAASMSERVQASPASNRKRPSEDTPISPSVLEEKLEVLQQQLLSVNKLPMRARTQKKKDLELEVAQLRKQVKKKRKAALNSCRIDPSILLDIALAPKVPKATRSSRKTAPTPARSERHQITSPERCSSRFKSPTPDTSAALAGAGSTRPAVSAPVLSSSTDSNNKRGRLEEVKKKKRPRDSRGLHRRRPPPRSVSAGNVADKKHEPDADMLSPEEGSPLPKTTSLPAKSSTLSPLVRSTSSRRSKSGRKRSRISKVSSSDSELQDKETKSAQVNPSPLPKVAEKPAPQLRSTSEPVLSRRPAALSPAGHNALDTGTGGGKVDLVRARQKRSAPRSGVSSSSSKRRKSSPRKPHHVTNSSVKPPRRDSNHKGSQSDTDVLAIPSATSEDMLTVQSSPKRLRKVSSTGNIGSNKRLRRSISASAKKPAVRKRQRDKHVFCSTDEEGVGEGQLNHSVEQQQEEHIGKKVNNEEGAKKVFENHVDVAETAEEESKDANEDSNDTLEEISPECEVKGSEAEEKDSVGDQNAASNGEDDLHLWDVVWAKCPGYPQYPALIVDPQLPKKGFQYYGAQVKCPTDEVYKLREKAPGPCFLVNFFDSRRTWYWLPGCKLDRLGKTQAGDDAVIKSCPPRSKRAVQQAYHRAQSFIQTVTAGKKNAKQPLQPANGRVTSDDSNNTSEVPKDNDAETETVVASNVAGDQQNTHPNSTPPTTTTTTAKAPVAANNCDSSSEPDGPERNQPSGGNIWNRHSDEVSAAEQLTLLNSYIPEPFVPEKRKRSSSSRTPQSNSKIQQQQSTEQKNSVERDAIDPSQPSGANCKVSHQNATREDEFIGEDTTSTSSVSGTPEVSSIA